MDTLVLAKEIAQEALDTKAQDLKILDLRELVSYTDYFILCTGTSDRQVKAIADRVHMKLKKKDGRLPISYEGLQSGQWVLLDYGDVVLHVFLEGQRQYYGLDQMWSDAAEISIAGVKLPAKPKAAVKKAAPKKTKKKLKGKPKPKKSAPAPRKKSPPKKKKRK
ncbi:MAG: ribosome silencing factor [Deltaproteobacteria bacterium]|nr:ribosome silencing factor [Deltaproteobacteria bacterium]